MERYGDFGDDIDIIESRLWFLLTSFAYEFGVEEICLVLVNIASKLSGSLPMDKRDELAQHMEYMACDLRTYARKPLDLGRVLRSANRILDYHRDTYLTEDGTGVAHKHRSRKKTH